MTHVVFGTEVARRIKNCSEKKYYTPRIMKAFTLKIFIILLDYSFIYDIIINVKVNNT